jgi:excisionase family DNA binding protein
MLQNEFKIASLRSEVPVHIAARTLECSERTVRRLIQLEILPAQRDGHRRWLLFRSDVEAVRSSRRKPW